MWDKLLWAGTVLAVTIAFIAFAVGITKDFQSEPTVEVTEVVPQGDRCATIIFHDERAGESPMQPVCVRDLENGDLFLWNGVNPGTHIHVTIGETPALSGGGSQFD